MRIQHTLYIALSITFYFNYVISAPIVIDEFIGTITNQNEIDIITWIDFDVNRKGEERNDVIYYCHGQDGISVVNGTSTHSLFAFVRVVRWGHPTWYMVGKKTPYDTNSGQHNILRCPTHYIPIHLHPNTIDNPFDANGYRALLLKAKYAKENKSTKIKTN